MASHPGLVTGAPTPAETETPVLTTPVERADTTHEALSRTIEETAKRIDRFFGDERAFEEDNESTLRLRLDWLGDERDATQFDASVKAKWALPGTMRRLRLVVEGDPLEDDRDSPESDPLRALDSPSDYIIGIESEVLANNWQIRPSIGMRFDLPVDPYARLRGIRYFDLGTWLARVSGTASWFKSDGVNLSAGLDLDRNLGKDLLFRSASDVLWEKDDSRTSIGQMFTVYDRLASRARIAYDVGATFDDDPNWRTTEYFLRLRYRRLFYKNWAYLEVQPKIGWPETNDYSSDLSLLLRLELNFGRGYR